MKQKFVFDERILLHLALRQLRTNRQEFERRQYLQLHLAQAEQLNTVRTTSNKKNPATDLELYSDNVIWATPSHTVLTTKYGKIKRVEQRRQEHAKPRVTVKRRMKIDRSQGN